MPQIYVSIGSNQSPQENIREGLRQLESIVGPLVCSPVYRSVAVGFNGDDFFNLAVGFHTTLPLLRLIEELRIIEFVCGRLRGQEKFSPRTLDLDILTYGNMVIQKEGLSIPRGEILHYAFVLKPLADIAAEACHPVLNKTYGDLWTEFTGHDGGLVHAAGFLGQSRR